MSLATVAPLVPGSGTRPDRRRLQAIGGLIIDSGGIGSKANYDKLLASTGSADAATLAAEFGIDVRSKEFWVSSLDVIRQDIDEFEALVNARTN